MKRAVTGFKWQKSLLEMLSEIVPVEMPAQKEMMGFTIPKTDYRTAKRAIEQNLMFDPSHVRFIPGSINSGPQNDHAGKLLSLNNAGDLVESAIPSSVIAVPGLGGADSKNRATKSLLQFRRLFPEAVLYSPINEGKGREQRYIRGLSYYQNEDFINPEESSNFCRDVIFPKMLDEKGKLLPPEKIDRITLIGFSIGSREIKSHISYLSDFLIEKGLDKPTIQKYFDKISVINIGSPINWSNHKAQYSPRPSVMNVVSATDMGTRKPDEMMRAIYLDSRSHEDAESLFDRPYMDEKGKDYLLVLGRDMVPNGKMENGVFVANSLGHNLGNYVDAISERSPAAQKLFDLQRSYVKCEVSDEELKKEIKNNLLGAREFEYNRELKEEDVRSLLKSWSSYINKELVQEDQLPIVRKIQNKVVRVLSPESSDPASACSTSSVINLKKFESNQTKNESEYLQGSGSVR